MMFLKPLNMVSHRGIVSFGGKSTHQSNTTDVYFTFEVEVRISNLWVAPYSTYQQFLYDTICGFRKDGWNYQQIADLEKIEFALFLDYLIIPRKCLKLTFKDGESHKITFHLRKEKDAFLESLVDKLVKPD